MVINAVGPTWEGNQTWLITAAGASFAAWPLVHATAFSGFYTVMVLTLFALFLRPVGSGGTQPPFARDDFFTSSEW